MARYLLEYALLDLIEVRANTVPNYLLTALAWLVVWRVRSHRRQGGAEDVRRGTLPCDAGSALVAEFLQRRGDSRSSSRELIR